MYADRITESMRKAISETDRRRSVQKAYNDAHGITPTTIEKSIRAIIEATKVAEESDLFYDSRSASELTKKELNELIKRLEKEMKDAATNLQFERAAELRDKIFALKLRR